jgi:16S rRNA pseudouridine516 synthase
LRLERFVSQALGVSRREAKALIRAGEISIDGSVVRNAGSAIAGDVRVAHLGQAIELPGPLYLMLHKPQGVVSATRDSREPTVQSLLPERMARRVHPVGRLDKDTTGLLLFTDDGAWSHRITSPRHRCHKTYRATLAESLVDDAESRLAQGLMLRSETTLTRPAILQRLGDNDVLITVSEGRYHLVRRLFAALGNRVVTLHRESIGGLALDNSLAPGEWRVLSVEERELALTMEVMG